MDLISTVLAYDNGDVGDCEISGVEEAVISGNYDYCGGNLTYTWTHIDACGRSISFTLSVTVLAGDIPYFLDIPYDITLECNQSTYMPPDLEFNNGSIDDCETTGFVIGTTVDLGNTIEVTWELINLCDGSLIVVN